MFMVAWVKSKGIIFFLFLSLFLIRDVAYCLCITNFPSSVIFQLIIKLRFTFS